MWKKTAAAAAAGGGGGGADIDIDSSETNGNADEGAISFSAPLTEIDPPSFLGKRSLNDASTIDIDDI
jgi:hypothetical protein